MTSAECLLPSVSSAQNLSSGRLIAWTLLVFTGLFRVAKAGTGTARALRTGFVKFVTVAGTPVSHSFTSNGAGALRRRTGATSMEGHGTSFQVLWPLLMVERRSLPQKSAFVRLSPMGRMNPW